MAAGGRHEHHARPQLLAFTRLDDRQRRELVEALGVGLGIADRHVQDNGDRDRESPPASAAMTDFKPCGPPVETPMTSTLYRF